MSDEKEQKLEDPFKKSRTKKNLFGENGDPIFDSNTDDLELQGKVDELEFNPRELRKIRIGSDISQRQLADRLGVSKSCISMMESGNRRLNDKVKNWMQTNKEKIGGYWKGPESPHLRNPDAEFETECRRFHKHSDGTYELVEMYNAGERPGIHKPAWRAPGWIGNDERVKGEEVKPMEIQSDFFEEVGEPDENEPKRSWLNDFLFGEWPDERNGNEDKEPLEVEEVETVEVTDQPISKVRTYLYVLAGLMIGRSLPK